MFLNCSRVVARPCPDSRRRAPVRRQAKPNSARTRSGAVRSSNPLAETRSRCRAVPCKSMEVQWKRSARRWSCNGVVVSGRTCCAARSWLDPLSTWSRTLMRVCLRALALPVLRYLTLCYACTVHDRRRWMHVLRRQHQRAGEARRCFSRLCTGLQCMDQWHAAESSADVRVASYLWCSWCAVLATVCTAHSMSSLS